MFESFMKYSGNILKTLVYLPELQMFLVVFIFIITLFIVFIIIFSRIRKFASSIVTSLQAIHDLSTKFLTIFMAFLLISNLNILSNMRSSILQHNNQIMYLYTYLETNQNIKDRKVLLSDLTSYIDYIANNIKPNNDKTRIIVNPQFYKLMQDGYQSKDNKVIYSVEKINDIVSDEIIHNRGFLDNVSFIFSLILIFLYIVNESIFMLSDTGTYKKLILMTLKSFILSLFLFMILAYQEPLEGASTAILDFGPYYKTQQLIHTNQYTVFTSQPINLKE